MLSSAAEDRTLFFFRRLFVKARKTNDMIVVYGREDGKILLKYLYSLVECCCCSSGSEMLFLPYTQNNTFNDSCSNEDSSYLSFTASFVE
jgi:hypothetical protein